MQDNINLKEDSRFWKNRSEVSERLNQQYAQEINALKDDIEMLKSEINKYID